MPASPVLPTRPASQFETVRALTEEIDDARFAQFSLCKAIQQASRRAIVKDSTEARLSNEEQARRQSIHRGITSGAGMSIPSQVLRRRDLTAASFSGGGAMVGDTVYPSFGDSLRAESICLSMGANVISDLKSDIRFVYNKNDPASTWLPESQVPTATSLDLVVSQVSPKLIGCLCVVSDQLLHQAGPQAEVYLRTIITRALAQRLDQAALEGAGGAEPLGILNDGAVGTVTFGAAATFPKILDMENVIDEANAPYTGRGFVTSPAAKRKLQAKEKAAGSGFIWENGMVSNYPARATTSIEDDQALIGSFAELHLVDWGLEILPDPYTHALSGFTRFIAGMWCDVAFRPQAFCKSTDSAAQ